MAIAFDNSTAHAGYTVLLTAAHVCGTGANRLLLVFCGYHAADDRLNGVTYNGVPLDRVGHYQYFNFNMFLYGLLAPASGEHDVQVSLSSEGSCYLVAMSFSGVDQSGIYIEDDDQRDNPGTTGTSVSITVSQGGLAVDCCEESDTADMTPEEEGQIELADFWYGQSKVGSSYRIAEGNVALSWACGWSTGVQAGIALKASTGLSQFVFPMFRP